MRLILPCPAQFSAVKAPAIALHTLALSWILASGCAGGAIAQTVQSSSPTSMVTAPATQRILYVNSLTGNDAQADGSEASPFRTITRALQSAQPQTIILLAAGTYSAETGEVFPLVMKPEVTIQGDATTTGQGFLIQGGGLFLSPTSAGQNIALLGANQAVLTGVTLTNPNPRGYGLWLESSSPVVLSNTFTGNTHDGISTVGNSAPLIQGNIFVRNGANGMTIFGNSRPQVRQNIFEQTGFGINISENAAPLIQENRISQNRIGIVVQEKAQPVIRGNLIEGSREDGVAAIAQALPDLGTASEPGNNIFMHNDRYDINASADQHMISAVGNPLLSDRITGRIDTLGVLSAPHAVMVASVADQIPVGSAPQSVPVLIDQLPPVALATSALPSSSAPATLVSATPTSASQILALQTLAPQASAPQTLAPQASAPQASAPQTLAPQASAPQTLAPQTLASAIPIPVPLPAQPAPSLPQRSGMNIPVPLPAQPSRSQPRPSLPNPAPPTLQADLLPVPSDQAPIGNLGDLPTVSVPGGSGRELERTAFTNSPSADLKYRVVVEANSDRVQKLVQAVVPGAFLIREHGRSLMQIGAFSSRDNAESAVQLLNQNGLRAVIEDFE